MKIKRRKETREGEREIMGKTEWHTEPNKGEKKKQTKENWIKRISMS